MFWTGIALLVVAGAVGSNRVRGAVASAWAGSEVLRARWSIPSHQAFDLLGVMALVVGVSLAAVGHRDGVRANAQLGGQVQALVAETKAQRAHIEQLESRSSTLTDENAALVRRLSQMEAETARIADYYGTAATWDFNGGVSLGFGSSVGGVGNWRRAYVLTDDHGDISWKCGPDGRSHYRRVIERHPKFPFPYYLLAVCLLGEEDEDWRTVAEVGRQVAERTTSVPDHHPAHDEVLDKLRILLRDGRATNESYKLARQGG